MAALVVAAWATVMLYGWWHRATHATLEVQLVYKAAGGMDKRLRNGQIEFFDSVDQALARATIDTRRGVVWLAHPDYGQCGPDLARDAYLTCFLKQSEWIAQWAERVRHANVALEGCSMSRVPVTLYTRRDTLFTWWVPLPHVGGKPYARHIATVAANQQQCSG